MELDMQAMRIRLNAMLAALDQVEDAAEKTRPDVELDQTLVGRLSRMDALQGDAMARATEQRRHVERTQIMNALERLDSGEYGFCQHCGDEIRPKRLEIDPTARLCIGCASGTKDG